MTLELRVERRDTTDLGAGQTQQVGAELDAPGGDVTVDGLHQVQQREQCGALARIAGDDLFRVGPQGGQHLARVGIGIR